MELPHILDMMGSLELYGMRSAYEPIWGPVTMPIDIRHPTWMVHQPGKAAGEEKPTSILTRSVRSRRWASRRSLTLGDLLTSTLPTSAPMSFGTRSRSQYVFLRNCRLDTRWGKKTPQCGPPAGKSC